MPSLSKPPLETITALTSITIGTVSTSIFALTNLSQWTTLLIVLINTHATANLTGLLERAQDGVHVDEVPNEQTASATKQARWFIDPNLDLFYRLSAIADTAGTTAQYGIYGISRIWL